MLFRSFPKVYASPPRPFPPSADVPKEQRLQAVRAAILLMSDENRQVLQTLLYFLHDVTSFVEENQMTAMNLAVCLGPSLFHLNILKNEILSPRYTHVDAHTHMDTHREAETREFQLLAVEEGWEPTHPFLDLQSRPLH